MVGHGGPGGKWRERFIQERARQRGFWRSMWGTSPTHMIQRAMGASAFCGLLLVLAPILAPIFSAPRTYDRPRDARGGLADGSRAVLAISKANLAAGIGGVEQHHGLSVGADSALNESVFDPERNTTHFSGAAGLGTGSKSGDGWGENHEKVDDARSTSSRIRNGNNGSGDGGGGGDRTGAFSSGLSVHAGDRPAEGTVPDMSGAGSAAPVQASAPQGSGSGVAGDGAAAVAGRGGGEGGGGGGGRAGGGGGGLWYEVVAGDTMSAIAEKVSHLIVQMCLTLFARLFSTGHAALVVEPLQNCRGKHPGSDILVSPNRLRQC